LLILSSDRVFDDPQPADGTSWTGGELPARKQWITGPGTLHAFPKSRLGLQFASGTEVVPVLLPMVRVTVTGLVRPVSLTPEAST
jgi:hypothetical protein